MDRLYIVVRSDLKPGLLCAQACHALRAFVAEHPEVEQQWFEGSNNLVVLQVPDEAALLRLVERSAGVPFSVNREPDLDNQVTAVALAPSAKRLLRTLPLALAS
jgi:peptidyl-tRNA hydrolase